MVLLRSTLIVLATCLAFCPKILSAETVLLDFSSPTCPPCQQMRPLVHRLAAAGHAVREIDISRDSRSAAQWRVTQVPTFIVLVDGRETVRRVGAMSYQELERLLPPINTPRRTPTASNALVAVRGNGPRTFASQPAVAAGTFAPQTPTAVANSLASPQPGRIVAIQPPASTQAPVAARPDAASPFNNQDRRPFPSIAGSQELQRKLLEATVRLSVKDDTGTSSGTGTLVDARRGEALVLTCGHIFRTSQGKGPIAVTLFQVGPNGVAEKATVAGQLIDFDLTRDLALVSIRTELPLRAVAVAPLGAAAVSGASVTTVGCNHGQLPTAINSRVTATDRYQGPPNVEVAGAPVEGRSGGGLFNAQGQLVGVCFAADPQEDEGLYASLPSVQTKLEDLELAMVFQSPSLGTPSLATLPQASPQADPTHMAAVQPGAVEIRGQLTAATPSTNPLPEQPNAVSFNLEPAEQAALEEIQRRGVDSEVICIIRPQTPGGKSEVITLNNASSDFVQALTRPATAAAKDQLLRR